MLSGTSPGVVLPCVNVNVTLPTPGSPATHAVLKVTPGHGNPTPKLPPFVQYVMVGVGATVGARVEASVGAMVGETVGETGGARVGVTVGGTVDPQAARLKAAIAVPMTVVSFMSASTRSTRTRHPA